MNMPKMIRKIAITLFFMIIFMFTNNSAFADYGDFYEKYKDHFKNWSDMDKDIVKAYDLDTNTFDCGTFDFYCKINGFLYQTGIGMVKASYSSSKSAVISPHSITTNTIFLSYKNALDKTSWLMLYVFLTWNIVKIVAHRFADAEDGMVALNEKILKTAVLAILLALYYPLFNYILEFQYEAVSAVMGNVVSIEDIALTMFTHTGFYGYIMAILIGGVMMIFQIAFLYRFVLFGVLYIMGVVAIPTGMNEEYNFFNVWLRLLISNGITLFLQALTFTLGVKALFVNNAFNNGTAFTVAMAFWILALSIPSLLGQMGASTGTSRAVGSIVRVLARRYR